MLSSRHFVIAGAMLLCISAARAQTIAAAIDWANTSNDFTNSASWTNGTIVNDLVSTIGRFGAATTPMQPTVGSAFSLAGVRFATGAASYTISGTGPLTLGSYGIENQTGTGAQTISVPLIFSTAATITNEGTLTISGSITNNTSGLTLSGGGSAGTISGAIGGTGGLTVSGLGKWTLSGANTYSGSTTISGGLLAIGSDGNLGTAPTTATAGALALSNGTLEATSSFTLTANRGISVSSSGGTLQVDGNATLTYGGVIAGSGSVFKTGTGTLTLGGANTYTGNLEVRGGTVADGAANAFSSAGRVLMYGGALTVGYNETIAGLGDLILSTASSPGAVTIAPGATLTIANTAGGGGTFSGTIGGSGALAIGNTTVETITGNATYTGGTTIASGGSLQIGDGTTNGTVAGSIVNNGFLQFKRSDVITYTGISGTGGVQQAGSGTLVLGGTNSYTGDTSLAAGTISDAAAGAFSPSSAVMFQSAGTTLNVNFNETVAGLGGLSASAGSTVNIGSGATLTLKATSKTYAGSITGAGNLTLIGSGTQTLSGASTYTGATTIKSGILRLGTNNALPTTGSITLNPSAGSVAQLDLAGFSQTLGPLTLSGAASTSSAAISVSGGALTLGGDVVYDATNNPTTAKIAGSTVTWSGNRTFNVGDSSTTPVDLLIASNIVGSGISLTKTGAGTLALSGYNSLSGGIVVNAGTLRIADASSGAISGTSAGSGTITMASGTTLSVLFGNATLSNAISVGSSVTLGDTAAYEDRLELTGTLTTQNAATTLHLGAGTYLLLANTITGPAGSTLTLDNGGRAIFAGSISSNVTGLTANGAAAVFVSAGSVPSTLTLQATNGGYIGVGATNPSRLPAQATPSSVLARIADKTNFSGTFGFDTDPEAKLAPHVFNTNLDFSAFTNPSFTIGSTTSAVLTGLITPPSTGYAFGNGGGLLFVQSNLTAPKPVSVVSASTDRALVAVLRGNNTFTGNLTIANSAVVLDSAHAMPSGPTVAMSGAASYFGSTEAFKSAANFLTFAAGALTSYNANSVLGLDSHSFVAAALAKDDASWHLPERVVSDTLDLSGFSAVNLGTFTNVDLAGSIIAPGHGTLSLVSLGEGTLTVSSSLTSANVSSVAIGSAGIKSDGTVLLKGANTYAGGTTLASGTLVVGHDSALGTGTLTINAGTSTDVPQMLSSKTSGVTIANSIALTTSLQLGRDGVQDSGKSFSRYLSEFTNKLTLSGAISGSGGLYVANGQIELTGSNSYTGTTYAYGGTLTFASASALPSASTLQTEYTGYIGIGFDTALAAFNVQSGFLDHFDKKTSFGTIGFDSPAGTQLTYSGAINLADPDGTGPLLGFSPSVRLGSATTAKLTGTITPSNNSVYQFGGGGGLLDVASALVDGSLSSPRSVVVSSSGLPTLTLRLSNTGNTYSGSTIVSDSALIFGPSALPSGTGIFVPNGGGYIGTEETSSANVTAFLGRFSTTLSTGTIGFDTISPASPYAIGGNLDLSRFTDASPNFYVGTTTSLVVGSAASITLPTNASSYRFAPYKSGAIEIDLALADVTGRSGTVSTGLVLGNPDAPTSASSRITLAGANTYTGGTSIYGGTNLILANAQAFSPTTTVSVQASNVAGNARPTLSTTIAGLSVPNTFNLMSDLEIAGSTSFTLAGQITGSADSNGYFAQLHKSGVGTLTLSGHNTFGGGVNIHDGTVTFTQSDSIGAGPLQFTLAGTTTPTANFLTSSTVNGIFGDNSLDLVNLTAGTTLTINQTFDSQFPGTITSSGASVVYQGTGTTANPVRLRVAGANNYNGSTTIGSGVTVTAANNNAFGPSTASANAVTLNGGKLAVDAGVTISNPITLTAGKLGGIGTFQALPSVGAFNIKSGVILAPGLGGPGALNFDGSLLSTSVLLLSGGGAYHWQLMDATNATGGWDTVAVNGTVNIAATSAAPFTFKLITVASDGSSGWAGNFDPTQPYTWSVLSATSITGFTGSNQFAVDSSGFINPNGGVFSLTLNASGTNLMLNFNPVPEPSTYALILAGLGLTLLASRRKRCSRGR